MRLLAKGSLSRSGDEYILGAAQTGSIAPLGPAGCRTQNPSSTDCAGPKIHLGPPPCRVQYRIGSSTY
jgi:hypothetical protein